jgi:hypothetical protein
MEIQYNRARIILRTSTVPYVLLFYVYIYLSIFDSIDLFLRFLSVSARSFFLKIEVNIRSCKLYIRGVGGGGGGQT